MVAVLYRNIKVSSLLYLLMHAAILSIDKIAHQTTPTLSTTRFFIIGFERVIFSAYLLMRLTQSLIAEFAKTLPLLEDTVGIF